MKFTTQHVLYQQHSRVRVVNFTARKIRISFSFHVKFGSKTNAQTVYFDHFIFVAHCSGDNNRSRHSHKHGRHAYHPPVCPPAPPTLPEPGRSTPTLVATHGQIDGFLSQLP
jgi:hypothetical protein